MKRLGNLSLFNQLPTEKVAEFSAPHPRTVRVTINPTAPCGVYVTPLEEGALGEEDFFVCLIAEMEEVEFYVEGPFGLHATAEIYFRTSDSDNVHAIVPDAQSFTRITERRAVDPTIQAMQEMMFLNEQRRMQPMLRDLENMRNELDNLRAGAPGGDKPAPEPTDRAGEPATSPAKVAKRKEESNATDDTGKQSEGSGGDKGQAVSDDKKA